MAQGICELLWMRIILSDLVIKHETPMRLFCESKSTFSIAHNLVHDRTKHIEIDQHFIKAKLDSGLIATICPLRASNRRCIHQGTYHRAVSESHMQAGND